MISSNAIIVTLWYCLVMLKVQSLHCSDLFLSIYLKSHRFQYFMIYFLKFCAPVKHQGTTRLLHHSITLMCVHWPMLCYHSQMEEGVVGRKAWAPKLQECTSEPYAISLRGNHFVYTVDQKFPLLNVFTSFII